MSLSSLPSAPPPPPPVTLPSVPVHELPSPSFSPFSSLHPFPPSIFARLFPPPVLSSPAKRLARVFSSVVTFKAECHRSLAPFLPHPLFLSRPHPLLTCLSLSPPHTRRPASCPPPAASAFWTQSCASWLSALLLCVGCMCFCWCHPRGGPSSTWPAHMCASPFIFGSTSSGCRCVAYPIVPRGTGASPTVQSGN